MLQLETRYGNLHPFRWAWVLYALAAIVLWLTSLAAQRTGYRIAWGLVLAGFALQLFGFAARILRYYPQRLGVLAGYVGAGIAVHVLASHLFGRRPAHQVDGA